MTTLVVWQKKVCCHRKGRDMMTHTNRDKSTLYNSSSKAVMVLHLLVHTESDRNSGVKIIFVCIDQERLQ